MKARTDIVPRKAKANRKGGRAADSAHLYQQARDLIIRWIEGGKYPPDAQLPSERDLSEQLGISRMTARHVYVTMQNDGLVYRADRKGWFVAQPRLHYALARSVSFLTNVQAEGGTPHAKLLSKEDLPAEKSLSRQLGLPKGARVTIVRRLLSVGKRPAMIEVIYMPTARFPGFIDLPLDQSISRMWQEVYGVAVARAEAKIRGGLLPPEDAAVLRLESTTPAIRLTEKMFDEAGVPIALSMQSWRHDIAEFSIDVTFTTGHSVGRAAQRIVSGAKQVSRP